jgi:hypothetical protein
MIGIRDEDYDRIVEWMVHVLDHCQIDHRAEAPAYDNGSHYDHAFYRIADTARTFWSPRLGYVPTDEALFRAFFEAEKRRLAGEKARRQQSLFEAMRGWFRDGRW